MSAFPDSEICAQAGRRSGLSRVQFAAVATTLAVLGLSAIWPTVLTLWNMWTTDALKSIGMIVPLVSMVLILRAWRANGWRAEGTWWGLPLILMCIVAVRIQERAILIMVISPHWSTPLPPPSLILFAYGSGVVLLLGGKRLYKAALFPIFLLWFVNPVPHVFSLWVDMPLQSASATIARAFAMHLGQPLTPDHLRLMFTPDFGMFIAPGCNGIRGSITMGFVALIAGYIYRFRWYANALVVAGAIILGYLFNLLRLCMLVLYYLVALHLTSLQNKAENADYLIGAMLFLIATFLLFAVIHRLREAKGPTNAEEVASPEHDGVREIAPSAQYARIAVMVIVVLFGCAGYVHASTQVHPAMTVADATERFPQHLGSYSLVRSWNETMAAGPVVYVWAQYSPPGGGTPIAIGISPVLSWHDPLICHADRGEHPVWQGQLTAATEDVAPIDFSATFYNDGVTQYLEATTQCNGSSCGEFATERTHFGFVYSHLDAQALLSEAHRQPVPVLLRVETMDTAMPADAARQQLTADMRAFLGSVKLVDLTRPYDR
jgi:exosortase J